MRIEYEKRSQPYSWDRFLHYLYGVDLLKALIAEFGFPQKDLVLIFKTESIVSAVLSGQRQLTVAHIEKLGQFFHISPAAFFPLG